MQLSILDGADACVAETARRCWHRPNGVIGAWQRWRGSKPELTGHEACGASTGRKGVTAISSWGCIAPIQGVRIWRRGATVSLGLAFAVGIGAAEVPICISLQAAPVAEAEWTPSSVASRPSTRIQHGGKEYVLVARDYESRIDVRDSKGVAVDTISLPPEVEPRISKLVAGRGGWLWIQTAGDSHVARVTFTGGRPAVIDLARPTSLTSARCPIYLSLMCQPARGWYSATVGQVFYTGYEVSLNIFRGIKTRVVSPDGERALDVVLDPHSHPIEVPHAGGALLRSLDDRALFYDGVYLRQVDPAQKPGNANRARDEIGGRTWIAQSTPSGRTFVMGLGTSFYLFEIGADGVSRQFSGPPSMRGARELHELAGGLVWKTANQIWYADSTTFRLVAQAGSQVRLGAAFRSNRDEVLGFKTSNSATGTALHYSIENSRGDHCMRPLGGAGPIILR